MTDVKPDSPPERWSGWTVPALDAAIDARRVKHDAAVQRGDIAAAIAHEEWIDRLLDGRIYLTTRGLS